MLGRCLLLRRRCCWLLQSFVFIKLCDFGFGAFLVGVCGPRIAGNLVFVGFAVARVALGNRLKVFIIILGEEGNVAHLKGTRFPLGSVLVTFYLLVLGAGSREEGVSASRTHQG